MAILVIGATGLLGQEIVIQALESGNQVKCMVRNINKSFNLQKFGAKLVYGDLTLPETLPRILKNTKIIIDVSTFRLNATYHTEQLDWYGKLVLLKAAKLAKIKRFIFFSTANVQYFPNVYMMNVKFHFEKLLSKVNLAYTIFRINGFLQGLIGEYSKRILNQTSIWIMKKEQLKSYFYIDQYDVARFSLNSLLLPETKNKTYLLVNNQLSLQLEFENLCKTVLGRSAVVFKIPNFLTKLANLASDVLESTWNIKDQFLYFEALTEFNLKARPDFYLTKAFRTNFSRSYSYRNYLQDYLDLIILDLQKLHND